MKALALALLLLAPAPATSELTELLTTFLAGASRNDPAVHDRFWAEDLVYTGSSGRRVGKADIMKDVRSEPMVQDPATVYSAEDVNVRQYGDTAVVTFRLVATTKGEAEPGKYYNTGTFVKRDGRWQVVAWQATKIPPPEPAKP